VLYASPVVLNLYGRLGFTAYFRLDHYARSPP